MPTGQTDMASVITSFYSPTGPASSQFTKFTRTNRLSVITTTNTTTAIGVNRSSFQEKLQDVLVSKVKTQDL